MDEDHGSRAVTGIGVSGRGSGLVARDASNCEEQGSHYCKRQSCNTRLKSIKNNQIGSSDRDRPSSSSFRSKTGKAIVGSSSRTYSAITDTRKPRQKFPDPSEHKETISSEMNNLEEEKRVLEPNTSNTTKVQMGVLEPEDVESVVLNGCSMDTELGSYNVTPNVRTRKQKWSGQGNHAASQGPSMQSSFASRNVGQGQYGKATRYGLRNLGCTSISDVLPSGCSSSDSSRSRVKRGPDGECSVREKLISGSSSGVSSGNQRYSLSNPSLSLSERPLSRPASRRTRYWPPRGDGITSVRTRRIINNETMSSISEHSNGSDSSLSEPPVVIPELPQTELSTRESGVPCPSRQAAVEPPAVHHNPSRRSFSRNENLRNGPMAYSEDDTTGPFGGGSINQDGIQRFNMDGIAEVLLALERIEQDEELTYEQLLVLEANLFFGGISFHDHHQDMRLDIDNMSYEELLALGEKMGTVSTALTEEQLSNCLKRSYYRSAPPEAGCIGHADDDVKCSICQEEYTDGDEVGKLQCDHRYHVTCIHQWLRLKNWCPICKVHAVAS